MGEGNNRAETEYYVIRRGKDSITRTNGRIYLTTNYPLLRQSSKRRRLKH